MKLGGDHQGFEWPHDSDRQADGDGNPDGELDRDRQFGVQLGKQKSCAADGADNQENEYDRTIARLGF